MAALPLDGAPPPADQGAPLPVGGAEALEHPGQALVGQVGGAVGRAAGRVAAVGPAGEHRRRDEGRRLGAGGAAVVAVGGGGVAADLE